MLMGMIIKSYILPLPNKLITVPIIPSSYRHTLLLQHHTHPSADHLRPDKTASRIWKVGYWVGMFYDINQYFQRVFSVSEF